MSQGVPMISKRKAKESAEKAVRQLKTEKELTKYISKTMVNHPFLTTGFEFRIDRMQLETEIKGLVEKFKIHGYEDRGKRMDYLQSVLRHKYVDQDTFSAIMRFLILMSESPTSVIHLHLENGKYDPNPDSKMITNNANTLDKSDHDLSDLDEEKDELHISYSSDSDLSDWQLSDSEDLSEKLQKITQEKCSVRLSRSFSEFSQITEISAADKRKELELYWINQNLESKDYLHSKMRHVELIPLTSQPMITTLLTLQSKFGEYWEWKVSSHKQPMKRLILEEDIIREILWKISDPILKDSVIFTKDWELNEELMVSSLSQSSLQSFMAKYRSLIKKLKVLREFVDETAACTNSRWCGQGLTNKPPKLYNSYAHCLSEIFNYVTEEVAKIEKNLKKECWKEGNAQPATTLIQMDQQLRNCFEIINSVKRFHEQGVSNWRADDNHNPASHWFCSIKLISCLEMYLNIQIQTKPYGIILYIFSKCLRAFFEDLLLAFDTLEWNCDEFYFKRDTDVNIRDCDFWAKSITVQPYEEMLKKEELIPLLCLRELMPKVATILKTMEMLKQLGEDFSIVVGKIPSSKTIVHDFITKLVAEWKTENTTAKCSVDLKTEPDFNTHFRFLGLEGSFVAEAFAFIMKPERPPPKTPDSHVYSLNDFVQISEIPVTVPGEILNSVVKTWIDPIYSKSQNSIKTIFKNHCVPQSMALFREVVLEGREDFAKAVTQISINGRKSEKFHYEDALSRNPKFQLLLDECYPQGREHFQIDFIMDYSKRNQYKFNVTLNFPLNIIVSPKSLGCYTHISMQLQKVRNSLWRMKSLKMKDCKPVASLALNRLLILRFSLIHYCSSVLSFLLFKIFNDSGVESVEFSGINKEEEDLDNILKVHEMYLHELEYKLFKHPLFENIILKQMVAITHVVSDSWAKGIPAKTVILVEDTLKKCWTLIASENRSFLIAPGTVFSELSSYVGPSPGYL